MDMGTSSLLGRIRGIWAAKIDRWFWALGDQGAVSLGTFLTSVILARNLPPAEYGIYVIIWGVFNFLNSLHSALVVIPATTRGAQAETSEIQRLAMGSMILTSLLVVPLGLIVTLATWALGRPELAPLAILVMILWQFQETIRRTFMMRFKHRVAAWGDIIHYLGRAGLIWAWASHGQISVRGTLVVMALAAGAASLVQTVQHGLVRMPWSEVRQLAAAHWEMGRWVLMTNSVALFLSQSFPWALAFFYSTAASAEYQAVANILGVTHPIEFGIGGLIYPAVARAKSERGEREAAKVGIGYWLQGGLLLLPFYLILLLWPHEVLHFFYGTESPYLALTGILRLFVFYYVLGYTANIMVIILNSLERTRVAFFSQLASATTTLLIGLPLIAWAGVIGATIAGGLTSLARLVASGFFLKQTQVESVKDSARSIALTPGRAAEGPLQSR
jgi:O-antigen/teichoic acid export membrane protein